MQKSNLIWIDLEMTGLDINKDKIIEITTLITDKNLNILAFGPELVIYQDKKILDKMDNWNKVTHEKSGLLKLVKKSKYNIAQAELKTITFLNKWIQPCISPMCGNSIYYDRLFISKYMPKLNAYFHYRSIDVSTIKLLVNLYNPHLLNKVKKMNQHRTMIDILNSIKELIFYKKNFFKLKKNID